MCMKNYNAEKIIFDKFTAFFNFGIFRLLLTYILCEINSSLGFQYFFLVLCRHVTDILKMCMKNHNAEKIVFDKFTAFFNLAIFRLLLTYNNGWKCILCEINSS